MSWNYRLVKRTFRVGTEAEEMQIGIHSAYYHQHTDPVPHSISAEPTNVVGESLDDLRQEMGRMMLAFDKPTLDYATFDRKPAAPVVHQDWRD